MKLHPFGNVFIRDDQVNRINSMLDSTVEIWEALSEDMSHEDEIYNAALFINFLKDIKKAGQVC